MSTIHPLAPQDTAAVGGMRQAALAHKGESLGPEARPMFDAMLTTTPAPADARVEAAMVGGIPGFWCLPHNAKAKRSFNYLGEVQATPRGVAVSEHGALVVSGLTRSLLTWAPPAASPRSHRRRRAELSFSRSTRSRSSGSILAKTMANSELFCLA